MNFAEAKALVDKHAPGMIVSPQSASHPDHIAIKNGENGNLFSITIPNVKSLFPDWSEEKVIEQETAVVLHAIDQAKNYK